VAKLTEQQLRVYEIVLSYQFKIVLIEIKLKKLTYLITGNLQAIRKRSKEQFLHIFHSKN
jgi:hypothetical protein